MHSERVGSFLAWSGHAKDCSGNGCCKSKSTLPPSLIAMFTVWTGHDHQIEGKRRVFKRIHTFLGFRIGDLN